MGGESGKETSVFVSVALVTLARSVYVFFRVLVVCFCLCWHRLSRGVCDSHGGHGVEHVDSSVLRHADHPESVEPLGHGTVE